MIVLANLFVALGRPSRLAPYYAGLLIADYQKAVTGTPAAHIGHEPAA